MGWGQGGGGGAHPTAGAKLMAHARIVLERH